ncbi:PQQ-binding-like beta-propeller repeat protein [Candidatus Sumerlaeota bacterium]|nr:PQQ-binding-like beta-propeller repeat protein [Candidatus Sumerlaeota bacterium]
MMDLEPKQIGRIATLISAILAIVSLAWWMQTPAAVDLPLRTPGMDGAAQRKALEKQVDLEGHFLVFNDAPILTTHPAPMQPAQGAWPRFRGEDFNNIAEDSPPLLDAWPEGGPPELWRLELGEGHAGAAVWNGRVYVLDYDEQERADMLRCFALESGAELWRRAYDVKIKRNHGISRTVPAVGGGCVVTIGPKCHVLCCDALTGEFKWGVDLVRQYGAKAPLWYAGQCPLIDGDTVVLAPGGPDALLIGLNLQTGAERWRSPNPRGWQMSHSSIFPMQLAGRRMYVYSAVGGIAGIAADGGDVGAILWESQDWNVSVVVPSPVQLDANRVFVTAGYGAGSMILRIEHQDDGLYTAQLERRLDKTELACEQQTPIFYQGRIYSVMTADGGGMKRQLVCFDLDAADGGVVWNSGKTRRFGLGPYLIADNKVLLLNDDGKLLMARADGGEYAELASVQALHGRDAWAPMAMVDGRLILRDSRTMICLDLRAEREAP